MRSSRISAVLGSVRALGEQSPVHVHGATPAARALIAARYALDRATPIVILCPDDDAAAELALDLETLSSVACRHPLAPWVFPGHDQSLYSPIAPSIRVRIARAGVLAGLSAPQGPPVIITSLAAANQATLPPDSFAAHTVSFELEASVESREAFVRRLVDAGYMRVDPVEDPGTFAVRGDIVDVFPPGPQGAGRAKPLRVELFGDLVERVREFDPSTQRASEKNLVGPFALPPARETLINAATAPLLRERLKSRADDAGISRAVRDPLLEQTRDGIYPERSDAWAPFAYEKPATLWDHLPPGSEVVWCDEMGALQVWDSFLEDQRRLCDEAPGAGVVAPSVETLFIWNSALESKVRARSRLCLDRLETADLESVGKEEDSTEAADPGADRVAPNLRVFVRGNGDLGRGSKQSLAELEPRLQLWRKQGFRILALASTRSQLERIRFLLEEHGMGSVIDGEPQPGVITLAEGVLSEGFRWPAEGWVVLTEYDLLGTRAGRRAARSRSAESGSAAKDWAGLQALSDLSVGDLVVHVEHGIGRYQGLVRLDLSGAPSDFLQLEYANRDKLYLPVYRLNVVQKYAGSGETVALDRLGSQQFAKTKEKVREAAKRLAIDLVQLYAERKVRPGVRFSPRDAAYREFEAKFPFDETPDQLRAIDAVLGDMESGKVTDRLVCGDVGYGKTEVAIRAAFRAVSDAKQVVVLVPTTILAHQHEQSFRARLKDYPIVIESLSRFKSAKEQKAVLAGVAAGKVDIVIGTHRLLSRDVKFHNDGQDLGLVIVDEEHRFGVEHKEKLKTLKLNAHVLTLTATPIPRTLHMALAGLRDISLINTPPVDRLPIRTYVSKYDEALIQRAVAFELGRGGQVFFLHNRVQSIHEMTSRLRELLPNARFAVAHGQMADTELEKAMDRFYRKEADVLVCTSIVESGLDLPSANTLIVNRADSLGLAQLYQIRGRVGRGQQRAYAYLLIPAEGAVTEDAKRRLEVIQRFVELGSGFSIASHDLELRGGGDLLGPQQSGHIAAVGFDLYTELLDEAIRELEGKPAEPEQSRREPEIKAPFPAYLAEEYVPDVHQRLSLYRRFSAAAKDAELDALEGELRDRFGPLPGEAQNLLWMIRIKMLLKSLGIDVLNVGPERVSLVPGPGSRLDPARAIALVSSHPSAYQLTPDSKLVARVPTQNLRDLYFALETLFKKLA